MYSTLFDIIGLIGVGLILIAYYLLQKGKINVNHPQFHWLNLIGSLMIIASLLADWNLPSFLMEVAWAGISLYGLWKYRKRV